MKISSHCLVKKRILSVAALTLLLIFSFSIPGYSQMTVVNGTNVRITGTTSLNSSVNMVLNAGGTLDVQGTLVLKKDLINQNAAANSLGTGAVIFSGAVNQTISGQNII
ncbi:MAG: hypothetical protein NT040_06325, partial [Bacteroidetes bacterium]|nr:hypothetical protein [Bacteroidota bacterium]